MKLSEVIAQSAILHSFFKNKNTNQTIHAVVLGLKLESIYVITVPFFKPNCLQVLEIRCVKAIKNFTLAYIEYFGEIQKKISLFFLIIPIRYDRL